MKRQKTEALSPAELSRRFFTLWCLFAAADLKQTGKFNEARYSRILRLGARIRAAWVEAVPDDATEFEVITPDGMMRIGLNISDRILDEADRQLAELTGKRPPLPKAMSRASLERFRVGAGA